VSVVQFLKNIDKNSGTSHAEAVPVR
jgi:hypothetical protein